MLKVRLIPTLLYKDNDLVKGVKFDSWRKVGSILPAVKVYTMRQVDELIIVDIAATKENCAPDFDLIKDFSCECFVPLTVGGGVKSIDDIRNLLKSGADKACINTFVYKNPNFIKEASQVFGAQCIVVSIDAKKEQDGTYQCYSCSGTKPMGINVVDWSKRVEGLGAGEILITSIDKDGTMQGYDLELIKLVTESVSIPVIVSGGAGGYKDFLNALNVGAKAIAAASIFHFTEQTPREIKKLLSENGITVRK
ncbi:imidazole glycerol phosphate synthase subunit HisF [Candidatus Dependentiae bacterium]|nr:imidazole glycerol phosphate synthase subunit HisF [Candidatus Dependentiae bacterium]